MDGNPKRRKKNKNLGPPALTEDPASGNSEEQLETLMREVEELKRVMEERQMKEEGEKLKSKMIAEILEPMKEFARLFEKEKPLIEEYLRELKDMAKTLLERDRAEQAAIAKGLAVAVAGCAGLALSPLTLRTSALLALGGLAVAKAIAGLAMSASPEIDEKRLLKILNRSQYKITALGTSAAEVCQALFKWTGYFYAEMAVLATASSDLTEATRVLTAIETNPALKVLHLDTDFVDWDNYDWIKNSIQFYRMQKTKRATEICNWVENGESDLANLAIAYSHVKVYISLIRDL